MNMSLPRALLLTLCACVSLVLTLQEARAQSCASPNLLIIIDKSGSMGSNNKWNDATKAINTITNQYKGKLSFGLEVFDSTARVIYGINTCVSAGANCVASLQAQLRTQSPGGGTNLIDAINKARAHITGLSASLKQRKTSVMFLTDGQASCANTQVSALATALGSNVVKTFVIGFGAGVTASCLNSMATAGRTALAGTRKYYQANNQTELNKAMADIANAASTEICNNNDDDCDGSIDEGLSRACTGPCGKGTETCSKGKWVNCTTARQPKPEICNNVDDDCDGAVDETLTRACKTACGAGTETCSKGKWANCNAPKPQKETCNNKDEDCDGTIDNGLKRPCQTACGKGEETCAAGKWDFCTAQKPQKETCNNKDDDCTGGIDDGLTRACNTACGAGTETCSKGQWVNCTGPQPKQETCDGKDEDCDGKVDNGLERDCQSKCGAGKEICTNGVWEACNARKPATETCNNRDDDCDGQVDNLPGNNPACPRCVKGVCLKACTQECPKGFTCKEGTCVELPCRRIKCGNDQVCREGSCQDICSNVTCEGNQICVKGSCVNKENKDCTTLGCPNGQKCQNKQCVPDTCANVTCEGREFCREGQCVESCANVTCENGTRCEDGKCVGADDPCSLIQCPSDEICRQGQCIKLKDHPCAKVTCTKDQYCDAKSGQCKDNPCQDIVCPGSDICQQGQCYGGTNPPPKEPVFPKNPSEPPTGGEGPINQEQPTARPEGTVGPRANPESVYQDGGTNTQDTYRGRSYQGTGCPCSVADNDGSQRAPFTLMLIIFAFLAILRRKQK